MSRDSVSRGFHSSDIDRLVHEPARYNIMTLLYVVDKAEFLFVQNHTGMTPGNLSAHASKLEAGGYVSVEKKFIGKKPKTFLKLTAKGRTAFEGYREQMQGVLNSPPEISRESEE